jgi:hypothetical protein
MNQKEEERRPGAQLPTQIVRLHHRSLLWQASKGRKEQSSIGSGEQINQQQDS